MISKNLIIPLFFIYFLSFLQVNSQEQLIKSGEKWSYFDEDVLANNWYLNANSSNWKTGITPIGYGDKKVSTSIRFGEDPENKDLVKYFSKTIEIDNPSQYLAFGFQIKRDDGIIVYVNNQEVFRNNLPMIAITPTTLATERIDGSRESEVLLTTLDPEIFIQGKNTISVSVHQASPSSSDCIFDLEMFGYTDPKMLSTIISNQSALNDQLENRINTLNTNLLLEKTALQLEIQENRAENLQLVLIVVSGLWILLLTVIILLFLNNRKKESKIITENTSLLNLLKDKEQEIMTLNTKILHTKQYFKEIRADLKSLTTKNDPVLKDLNYQISQALHSDEEWEGFQKHFNSVYSGFYDKLLKKHPSLTEVELRHCMFIKLHLQTKEIAKILLIDPRSVQTSRYRIKKKMELSEDMDLRKHLLSIT